jgi:hypothetical protein
MATSLTKRQATLLRGPSKAFGELLGDYVERWRDDTLREAIDACDAVTETNCWYVTYDLAPLLKVMCKKELAQRECRRGAKKRKV